MSELKKKGLGGIETHCLVESKNDNEGCLAVITGLTKADVQRIETKIEELKNIRDLSEESKSAVLTDAVSQRAKMLSQLLGR